ncbi:MAG: glucosamine-6-phosphate deaminase [Sphingobacteriales bacterium]|nr:MAG: glucosamine-6-phosphate deaminase [Sphingobacteriales bacterium]
MTVKIFDDYNSMSAAAADIIIETVKHKPEALLCFATGNTPVRTYEILIEKAKASNTDFSRCFCIGLDEWIGVPKEKYGTCHYLLHQQVFNPLGIKSSQIHIFDGMNTNIKAECNKMDAVIDSKGGVDCMLVGIGINGHIGFNEPGVDVTLKAHEQELHGSTLASGQHYFNEPTPISKGITLGLAQVLKAKKLLLLANGKSKTAIIKQAVEGELTNKVPASYVQRADNAIIIIDKEAGAQLSAK